MLGSKEIYTINNSDIYDTCKDFYLSKKECKEKLLQGIQLSSGLKARVGGKKTRWYSTDNDNEGKRD